QNSSRIFVLYRFPTRKYRFRIFSKYSLFVALTIAGTFLSFGQVYEATIPFPLRPHPLYGHV
ncbi:MAG TPA: hypothetical protein PL039_02130, partial [Kiritimatiellia bacterium]|nr:hypothetical protein [Kiritimatiellia bacterium]